LAVANLDGLTNISSDIFAERKALVDRCWVFYGSKHDKGGVFLTHRTYISSRTMDVLSNLKPKFSQPDHSHIRITVYFRSKKKILSCSKNMGVISDMPAKHDDFKFDKILEVNLKLVLQFFCDIKLTFESQIFTTCTTSKPNSWGSSCEHLITRIISCSATSLSKNQRPQLSAEDEAKTHKIASVRILSMYRLDLMFDINVFGYLCRLRLTIGPKFDEMIVMVFTSTSMFSSKMLTLALSRNNSFKFRYFCAKTSSKHFPIATISVLAFKPDFERKNKHVILKTRNKYSQKIQEIDLFYNLRRFQLMSSLPICYIFSRFSAVFILSVPRYRQILMHRYPYRRIGYQYIGPKFNISYILDSNLVVTQLIPECININWIFNNYSPKASNLHKTASHHFANFDFVIYRIYELQPEIKSQPVPKGKPGPVQVVVGSNFGKIVLDETKDVLIELYAPWCGHCKALEPTYKKLAQKYRDEANLVIAKLDATANDVPAEYKASGFPTIFFAPKGGKSKPVKYEEKAKELFRRNYSKLVTERKCMEPLKPITEMT
ncbi:disulfide-isomerase A4, partial [Paramuricea clavata]